MRQTGWLLVGLLLLANAGCAARRDWMSDLLVFVDVNGQWEGTLDVAGVVRQISWTLQQNGARVTGEASGGSGRRLDGTVEGIVKGEVFTFSIGQLSARGTLNVSGDERVGEMDLPLPMSARCPCPLYLRRSGAARAGAQTQ